jgi:hypothetical protein
MPFTTSFFYKQNETSKSIKCNGTEKWAENWIDVTNLWQEVTDVPCSTNDALVAYFDWDGFSQKL